MYNDIYVNSKVISGKNCVVEYASMLDALGKKCLIVTGKSGARKSGALEDVCDALNSRGIEYDVFNEIGENPLVSSVIEGGRIARKMKADFIIGIGGGSPLDASKAVAICAENPNYDIDGLYNRVIPSKALPVVLVGTTAGTGSEVTGVSVLTNDNTRQKKSIGGADCYATLVFADSKYTNSMSYNVTVSTALDAFAHAVEGWFAPGCTAIADTYARLSLPVIYKGLKELYSTGQVPDEKGREELYRGSLLAGMELNICGALFPHTVGYVLTEEFGVPHGKACAVLMPFLLERAKKYSPTRYAELFEILGVEEKELFEIIKSLSSLENAEATSQQIDEWCSRWGQVKNFDKTPGGFTNEDAAEALKSVVLK